jgi:hypothetical protein
VNQKISAISELEDKLERTRQELDAVKLALDCAEICAAGDQERIEELSTALSKARRCLGFFASVIKSGESWTATCQREFDNAMK